MLLSSRLRGHRKRNIHGDVFWCAILSCIAHSLHSVVCVLGDDQEITACQERFVTDYNAMLFTEEREAGGIVIFQDVFQAVEQKPRPR